MISKFIFSFLFFSLGFEIGERIFLFSPGACLRCSLKEVTIYTKTKTNTQISHPDTNLKNSLYVYTFNE